MNLCEARDASTHLVRGRPDKSGEEKKRLARAELALPAAKKLTAA